MSTLARIQDLAAKEFSIDPKSLDPHAQLDTLGIDSLSFIEFMFKVEEEFGVSVSDENLKASRRSPTSSVTSSTPSRRRQGLSRSRMVARRVAVTGAGVVSPSANRWPNSTRRSRKGAPASAACPRA